MLQVVAEAGAASGEHRAGNGGLLRGGPHRLAQRAIGCLPKLAHSIEKLTVHLFPHRIPSLPSLSLQHSRLPSCSARCQPSCELLPGRNTTVKLHMPRGQWASACCRVRWSPIDIQPSTRCGVNPSYSLAFARGSGVSAGNVTKNDLDRDNSCRDPGLRVSDTHPPHRLDIGLNFVHTDFFI